MQKFLVIAVLLVVNIVNAQSKFGIKLYNNLDYFNVVHYEGNYHDDLPDNPRISFNRFSLGLNFGKGKTLNHELEIFVPEINRSPENIQFPRDQYFNTASTYKSASVYALRYEVNKLLYNASAFTFWLGAGINPYFKDLRFASSSPNSPSKFILRHFGISVNLIPHVNYSLSDRISLNLSIPFKVYDIVRSYFWFSNPGSANGGQTNWSTDHLFFEDVYTIRLGVMYQFSD